MSLPTLKDCQDGMSAINLARHIINLIRNNDISYQRDKKISEARDRLDWESMRNYSINPYNPRWDEIGVKQKSPCSHCGPYCPLLYNSRGG
jgi:phosphomethylpyrimidine synthase